MPSRKNFPNHKEARREGAKARQAERETRGDQGQLNHLKSQGFGECREAVRLEKKLEKS